MSKLNSSNIVAAPDAEAFELDPAQQRLALVMGQEGLAHLKASCVWVLGVGGVGSNCCEALARGGVGKLVILDRDVVELSNINRQAVAWRSTVGQYKVDVMQALIADINPACEVVAYPDFLAKDTLAEQLDAMPHPDYVIDAIDTVTQKLLVATWCQERGVREVSSMGGANKLNPCRLKFADIEKTSGDRLCRIMRKECRKRGIPHLQVLFSDEPTMEVHPTDNSAAAGQKAQTLGTMSYMPAIMGQMLAGRVICELAGITNPADTQAMV